MSTAVATPEPLLRTLAPALRRVDERLRGWLAMPRSRHLPMLTQATLDGLSADLQRQSVALDVDRPLLIIALLGGTGVGKSSLLNALARGPVAHASYSRPTTRDPVVYYHQSIRPDRLDPALQQCRLVAHDRPALEQKILLDTPDLDSNELVNRERLRQVLPVADVILYVGSQEKYHDRLGWELFLEQRQRRAFAFVLNKWDRCLHAIDSSGRRPDEDLLGDLRAEGFAEPLLFRTCAQAWVESNGHAPTLPDGEQFQELESWLEMGLTRLEIEAIKARGVSQLIGQLEQALEAAMPPDLRETAEKTQKVWRKGLHDEAEATANVMLLTVDPYQREIEQHFSLEGHRRFRGLMAGFLQFATKVRYLGATLRKQLPRPLRGDVQEAAAASAWDLAGFSKSCAALASDRHLDARGRALPNHLLVLADDEKYPVDLLSEPTEAVAQSDWRQRFATILLEVLHEVESEWARPTGPRKGLQTALIWLSDILPLIVLLLSCAFVINNYFQFWPQEPRIGSVWEAVFLPAVMVLATLVFLYVLTILLLPIRWRAIRGQFHKRLTERIRDELHGAFVPVPMEVAESLLQERKATERLVAECREVATWLRAREQAAHVGALYGS